MNEDFMPQKCEASKCDSAVDIFYIVYVRHSVVPVHSPCRVITHSVKGLSDMRHCNKDCQCFGICTNVQCKYKPQSDVKYLQDSKSEIGKSGVLCGKQLLEMYCYFIMH